MTQNSSYTIDDPRPIAKNAPYTFYLPDDERLALLQPGDRVQLIIRSVPPDRKYSAERMWLEILTIDGDDLTGHLRSTPLDMPQLSLGDLISFHRWQVIDYGYSGEGRDAHLPPHVSRQRWERCLVDKEVLEGKARVGFIYRELPDMTREGDNYADSGWRIRADVDQLTDEQYENSTPEYIALGKVLNVDDSWIHLIDEPVGARYLRNPATGIFEIDEDP